MKKEEFLKLVSSVFKKYGFSKKGNNYYLDFDNDFVGVFGLQKSTYDAYYYIEFGFAIKNLNPKMPFPKYYELNLNFDRIKFDFSSDVYAVFYENLNKEAFNEIIEQKILWFIEMGRSGRNSIRKNFCEFGSYAIGKSSLAYLEISPDSKPVFPETLWI